MSRDRNLKLVQLWRIPLYKQNLVYRMFLGVAPRDSVITGFGCMWLGQCMQTIDRILYGKVKYLLICYVRLSSTVIRYVVLG